MYQQQEVPHPHDERNYTSTEYDIGYAGNVPSQDQLADAIARRLQAPQVNLNMQASQQRRATGVEAMGMRLGLAIVSVLALIPLAGIALSTLGSPAGLIALGVMSVVILGINAIFNNPNGH
jgi:hypothetical protein